MSKQQTYWGGVMFYYTLGKCSKGPAQRGGRLALAVLALRHLW